MAVQIIGRREEFVTLGTFLVERYLPGRDRAWLEEARRFEASGAEDVRLVNEPAGVPFARVTAATELTATTLGHDKGGESS